MDDLQIRAAAEALQRRGFHRVAEQDDGVAFVLEPLRGDVFQLFDEADDGNRGRRVDRAGGALIVERAIAAGADAFLPRPGSADGSIHPLVDQKHLVLA